MYHFQFVAHASCQQLLVDIWNTGMTPFNRASRSVKFVMIVMFTLAYPFLVIGHVLFPKKMVRYDT